MKVVIFAGGFGTRLMEETEARPKPSLMLNTCPVLPKGKLTATATGPGTSTLTTSSVVTTVTGVATAVLTARICVPAALIVIVLAPVPVVGVTVMPVPAKIDVGLFVYDILFPLC